ncbi:MAG: DUF5915 domain-containing protein, partial [Frankia sp.]
AAGGEVAVKPTCGARGRRGGTRPPRGAAASAAAGPPVDGRLTLELDGETIEVSGDELIITETPLAGWAVASEAGLSVALDLEITPELARAGTARDVVRVLQDTRKALALDVTDRIEVWWSSDSSETGLALREHAATVAREVLAVSFVEGRPVAAIAPHHIDDLDVTFWLRGAGT